MKRFAVLAASALVAVLAVVGGPAPTQARVDQSGNANLTIVNASSTTYPSPESVVLVCWNGGDGQLVGVGGTPYEIEAAPGDWEITVFESDAATCTDTPDRSITLSMAAGDIKDLVVGYDTLFEVPFDGSCMEAGTGRLQVANGSATDEPLDLYAESDSGEFTLVQAAMTPGQSATVASIPVGTYELRAYTPGVDPEVSAPVTLFGGVEVQEGFQVQAFLVGQFEGDDLTGSFTLEQGPEVCAEELPPTTTTTASTTTTTTAVVSPGAAPAVPVSGTAAYTG